MKRDIDLIRSLLLRLEEVQQRPLTTHTIPFGHESLAVEGHTADEIGHALELMLDAGFLQVERPGFSPGGAILFQRLTWQGCEYLDDVRDPEVWRRTKDGASKVGGASLSFVWEMAKAYGKQVAKERLGLDL
nr:DUF2513 domain-containing protein [Methylobacterium sp. L1A1]